MRFGTPSGLITNFANSALTARIIEIIDRRAENRMREFGMLAQAFEFKRINGVPGDYFEFGLWRGKTFMYAHTHKGRYGFGEMKLWGFDSFEGLPAIDDAKNSPWHKGQFACTEDELRRILQRKGLKAAEYELVKGFYDQSLNDELHARMTGTRAAIVYVDCDLHSSTLQVLNFVKRYLSDGSIVCFDEYWGYRGNPEQGEQLAIRDFLAANRDIAMTPWLDYAPLGKSFIVRMINSS